MGTSAVGATSRRGAGGSSAPARTSATPPLDVRAMRARLRDEGMARPHPWANVGHLLAQIALYGALAAVGFAVDRLWVWALAWAAMGLLLLAPGGLLHQSVHGLVFRHRWANHVLGDVAGAILLFPRGTYRAFHVEHHATTATADDPEGVPLAFGSRLELALLPLGGIYTVGQLWWFTARTLVGRPPKWVRTSAARRDIVISSVVVAAFAGLLAVGFAVAPSFTVHVWLVPYLVALVVVYPGVFLPEHAYGAPGPALENSRTTVSNRLVSWLFWNNNFHAIHHLLPTAVHQHARTLSFEVRAHQPGDWWNPGYVHYLWSVARRLPTFPSRRSDEVIDLRD